MKVTQLITALMRIEEKHPGIEVGKYAKESSDGPAFAMKLKQVEVKLRRIYDFEVKEKDNHKDVNIVEFDFGDWL